MLSKIVSKTLTEIKCCTKITAPYVCKTSENSTFYDKSVSVFFLSKTVNLYCHIMVLLL